MRKNPLFIALLALLSLPGQIYGQMGKTVINFMEIQGPISVQKNAYQLAWSAHPDASLYKQEYLAVGDNFPNYKSMVTVDFAVTGSTVDQAVETKVRELENLKRTNPIVNYEVISNPATGEKIIDCLIGTNATDVQTNLIERDIFRFKQVKAKSGQRGILLFAVSVRKYGNEVTPFLLKLKSDKAMLVNEVAKLSMPEINVMH
ncbi:hypothetical protein [Spirosoma flavum]|uniref:DUF1795 domain-containing protein n=1 Tax=Spirosoma flavum TaxID=2048557 RepID=A0ABW6AJS4_9BACT